MQIKLKDIATRAPEDANKDKIKKEFANILEDLDKLQNLLYAEHSHAILVVIQGMDASGKDGLINDVFSGMNPQGVNVTSFKTPTQEELAHDFLWRIHAHVPPRGMIQVFNRSQYEDILITRVHKLIDDDTAEKRMAAINDFERLLYGLGNTTILKFYLHVSEKEQLKRLEERMIKPSKMWKYNEQDAKETALRAEYIKYYEEVFTCCDEIPWHIVPADQNWYKSYYVANVLRDTLTGLNMKFPKLTKDI